MTEQQQPPKITLFQQMIQSCARAKKGCETAEDLLFITQHFQMAQLIMTRVINKSQV